MGNLDQLDTLFILNAFLFQLILITHFSVRKWHFSTAIRYGPIVYAMSIPAFGLSVCLLMAGKTWAFWISGFLYLAWAITGYYIEYVKGIQWRNPIRWSVLIPYISLYLATVMFYWWPLTQLYKPLWYIQGLLFLISTSLNAISHRGKVLNRNQDTRTPVEFFEVT